MQICLIISGSIAAYKSLDLIRELRRRGHSILPVMTQGAKQFITPLSVASLAEHTVYDELFSLKDEVEMGHIQLSRKADLILVAPASANLMAKMANGIADDLASTLLLAANKPVYVAPAMNSAMWENPATVRNVAWLKSQGVRFIGPDSGGLACGETGEGRMVSVEAIVRILEEVEVLTSNSAASRSLTLHAAEESGAPLKGKKVLVTSGPTFEAIDPVRFIGNRSSGKQGHAIAAALAKAGAEVTLISGPVAVADPQGVTTIKVESAEAMLNASIAALPVDIAICAAAVADWRAAFPTKQKMKKGKQSNLTLELVANTDILATLAKHPKYRPSLVIGFAAESELLEKHAEAKLHNKGCDWILANDISQSESTFGSDTNHIVCFKANGSADRWPLMTKEAVAERLVNEIYADVLSKPLIISS